MSVEHVDVVVVGAGLSGIGLACHLQDESPGRTFAILEARGAIGGTWDLFRYPGIRSDSDMYTFGYRFRPWLGSKALADGASIRSYIIETARERGVDEAVRFHHRVLRAEWSSADARWTVEAETGGQRVRMTCSFLSVCSGYYRYDEGYTPELRGLDRFAGRVVHPQHWPDDLDYEGDRVVVVGSGATAVTLVPAMAEKAGHVTMLQRSPSYVASLPARDPLADLLGSRLPARVVYPLVRWKNVLLSMVSFQVSRRRPGLMKALLRRGAQRLLPEGYDVDTHFAPSYDPWDQRLCLVPDGDLFKALGSGRASVVTDRIDTFTERGIRLESGAELEADLVITATGLNLLVLGGMTLVVDGREVDLSSTVSYKGVMLSGVPSFSLTLGYTNASWTLKADLVAHYVCRLLNHMRAKGYDAVTPVVPEEAETWEPAPLIDLASGYVLRSLHLLPKQGPAAPWRLYQNYPRDVRLMRRGAIEGDGLVFSRVGPPSAEEPAEDPHVA